MEELLIKKNEIINLIKEFKKPIILEYHKQYQNKLYHTNPEFAEKKRKQILEKYHATITEEQKQLRNEKAKAYYQANKEKCKLKSKEYKAKINKNLKETTF